MCNDLRTTDKKLDDLEQYGRRECLEIKGIPVTAHEDTSNGRAVECNLCLQWLHFKCSGLSQKHFNYLSKTHDVWFCQLCCCGIFHFHELENEELLELSFNSNTVCHCSAHLDSARIANLPHLNIVSAISNLPNLSHFDLDLNIPCQVKSKNYSPHEFHTSNDLLNLSEKPFQFYIVMLEVLLKILIS